MKKIISLLVAVTMLLALLPPAPALAEEDREFRAVWVATVTNLDYPSAPGVSVDKMKSEAGHILDKAAELGFNAVVLQVRPTGDAFYKSSLFPWSAYLTGEQGRAPAGGFDPLEYWVSEAHSRGLELHAWINPFRVTRVSTDNGRLSADNPALKHPEWVVRTSEGLLIYNPGLPEVRELVIDGVREIVENYAVDGVHFDDYFYPGKDFADENAFAKYGKNYNDIGNWRRENINRLIEDTYNAVKAIDKDCEFGVAPVAIWANRASTALGSDTNGQESYYAQYADTRKWVKNNWLDYIAPQIYWSIGQNNSDYSKVLSWWVDTVKGTDVKLYVGHATWRLGSADKQSAWYGTNEIVRQVNLNRTYPEVKGSIHFRFAFIDKDSAIQAAVSGLYSAAVQVSLPVVSGDIRMPAPAKMGTLSIGRPTGNITQSQDTIYFVGASDPSQKLTVNGTEITNRTSKGYFGYLASLSKGANKFEFKQGSATVTRTITCQSSSGSSGGAAAMSKAEIVSGSTYPNTYDELKKPGETVTLKCVAPIGATVSVRLNGKTYEMQPASTANPGDGKYYSTSYTHEYKIPEYSVSGRLVTVGVPLYTMTIDDKVSKRAATAAVKCVTPGARLYAEVVSDAAFLFPDSTTSGGPSGELAKGQKDYVVSMTSSGAWVKLNIGMWVQRSEVAVRSEADAMTARLTGAQYSVGAKWETLSLASGVKAATKLTYDGSKIVCLISSADSVPSVSLPSGSLFSSVTGKKTSAGAEYTFTLAAGKRLDGFYTSVTGEGVQLNFKRPLAAKSGDKPLDGINIMLDPGHGEKGTGAPGPWGTEYGEDYINLYAGLKLKSALESLGARVTITRTTDDDVSLANRVVKNRAERPDLFLSLHCNSLEFYTNASGTRGALAMYSQDVAKPFAETLIAQLQSDLGVGKRGTTKTNLYVCRPQWCPSMLLEMAFMCNPEDYEWLMDDAAQNEFVQSMAKGIVRYFS